MSIPGFLARIVPGGLMRARTLQAGTGITITNPQGQAGDPEISCTVSPTTPGGSDQDYQYNNAGAFAGGSLKRATSDRTDIKNGANAQEFRIYKNAVGGALEILKFLWSTDFFAEPCASIQIENSVAGSDGIEFRSEGSISLQIPGAFPVLILYHDPTSSGGISLIPNGSGFIGLIACDQSGSFMWTSGGFGVNIMHELISNTAKAEIFGEGVSGADFSFRYLTFDTTSALKKVFVGKVPVGGAGAGICFIPDLAFNGIVANLPAAPPSASILWVVDALAPVIGNAVVGGGGAFALCCFNGSAWNVIGI